jgi:hypothetical protein
VVGLQREVEQRQGEHKYRQQELLEMQEEAKQEAVYQQTIKKQEVVIAKLENLLERSVTEKFRTQANGEELEKLKGEISTLQKQVRSVSFGPGHKLSEIQRLKKETANLENLLWDLKEELNNR